MLFVRAGIPALAITSAGIFDLLSSVVHTAADVVDGIDPESIAETAAFVHAVLTQ